MHHSHRRFKKKEFTHWERSSDLQKFQLLRNTNVIRPFVDRCILFAPNEGLNLGNRFRKETNWSIMRTLMIFDPMGLTKMIF